MNITLLVPVLNEIDGLKEFMPQIPKHLFQQIIIADGNSKDGSAAWAKANGYETIIQSKPGIRHAYIESFPYIKNEWVITFSPDGNCLIEDLEKLVSKAAEGYDMVIGSRYLGGQKSDDDDIITRFGNWLFTSLINCLFKSNYTDAMTIYRIYRTKLFYDLKLNLDSSYSTEKLFNTVIGVEPLLSVRAAKNKLKVTEIFCHEPLRLHGKRKLQVFRWGSAYLCQIIKEFLPIKA